MDKKNLVPVMIILFSGLIIGLQWNQLGTQPPRPNDVYSPGQIKVVLIVATVVWVIGVGGALVTYLRRGMSR